MNKPFRIRARRLIIKIVNTRTYLIRKNKDKKEIPIVALEIIKEKINKKVEEKSGTYPDTAPN